MIINYLPAIEHPLFKSTVNYLVPVNTDNLRNNVSGTSLMASVKPGDKLPSSLIDFFLKQSITRY